jgi:hypothetical protein
MANLNIAKAIDITLPHIARVFKVNLSLRSSLYPDYIL